MSGKKTTEVKERFLNRLVKEGLIEKEILEEILKEVRELAMWKTVKRCRWGRF